MMCFIRELCSTLDYCFICRYCCLLSIPAKVLSALGLNLSNKSVTYNDTDLGAVFMLNNFNYILKSLRQTGLLELLMLPNKPVAAFYNDQILEQKKIYSQRYSQLTFFSRFLVTPCRLRAFFVFSYLSLHGY